MVGNRLFKNDKGKYADVETGRALACITLDNGEAHVTDKKNVKDAITCIQTLHKIDKCKWRLVL